MVASWSDPGARLRPPFACRFFFSWSPLGAGRIAGYFGVHLGGNDYHDDAFQARFVKGRLLAFVFGGREWLDGRDHAVRWSAAAEACARLHQAVFCHWMDIPGYERTGALRMAAGQAAMLSQKGWDGWELAPNHVLLAPPGVRGQKVRAMARLLAQQAGFSGSRPVDADE